MQSVTQKAKRSDARLAVIASLNFDESRRLEFEISRPFKRQPAVADIALVLPWVIRDINDLTVVTNSL